MRVDKMIYIDYSFISIKVSVSCSTNQTGHMTLLPSWTSAGCPQLPESVPDAERLLGLQQLFKL